MIRPPAFDAATTRRLIGSPALPCGMAIDWSRQRVVVTGSAGFLGRAVVAALKSRGVAPMRIIVPRSASCDLRQPSAAHDLLATSDPTVIIHAAARSGGLQANRDHPAAFFHDNIAMAVSLIDAAARQRATTGALQVLVFVGSMTSYPAAAPQPLREDDLNSGDPEPDVAAYGLAKRAALAMLRAYHREHGLPSAYVIPTNLYGPGDNIDDVRNAHVAGSLIKRFVDAARDNTPEVVCWGTGSPTRQFLFVDDAAEGVLRAAEVMREPTPINLAGPEELSIRALADLIAELTGYHGRVQWDTGKPNGQARRALNVARARELLDWAAPTSLREGLRRTVEWYRARRS